MVHVGIIGCLENFSYYGNTLLKVNKCIAIILFMTMHYNEYHSYQNELLNFFYINYTTYIAHVIKCIH